MSQIWVSAWPEETIFEINNAFSTILMGLKLTIIFYNYYFKLLINE